MVDDNGMLGLQARARALLEDRTIEVLELKQQLADAERVLGLQLARNGGVPHPIVCAWCSPPHPVCVVFHTPSCACASHTMWWASIRAVSLCGSQRL